MPVKERSSVAGIAIENGKIFIARRKSGGDLGGKWEFPGGKVRPGEGDREALEREYLEELSVPIEAGDPVSNGSFEHNETHFTLRAYRIRFLSKEFVLREHSEYRWVLPQELEGLNFAESDRLLFPALGKILGQPS
jgi:8-oxo-dGTP diphosphatase